MKTFLKENYKQLLVYLSLILLGLLFVIFSNSISNYIVIILGVILVLFGGSTIAIALYQKKRINPTLNFYKGGISLIIGLLLIIFSKHIINLILLISGFIIVLSSLLSLYTTWKLYVPSKERNVRLILSSVELIIGLILTFSPQESISLICIILGIYLIYKGGISLLKLIAFKNSKNNRNFSTNFNYESEYKKDPNIIDQDEIKDDDILKK